MPNFEFSVEYRTCLIVFADLCHLSFPHAARISSLTSQLLSILSVYNDCCFSIVSSSPIMIVFIVKIFLSTTERISNENNKNNLIMILEYNEPFWFKSFD